MLPSLHFTHGSAICSVHNDCAVRLYNFKTLEKDRERVDKLFAILNGAKVPIFKYDNEDRFVTKYRG